MNKGTDRRYLSLDILKAVGILYLLVLHQMIWIFSFADVGGLRYPGSERIILGFYRSGFHVLGLVFPLLAGVSFYLAMAAKELTGKDVIKRTSYLLSMGFLMNFLAWGPESLFTWDVLPFVALSMCVSFVLLKYFPRGFNLAMVCLLGLMALSLSGFFPLIQCSDQYWYQVVIGSRSGEHYWPFCPWYFLFSIGIMVGYSMIVRGSQLLFRGLAGLGALILGGVFAAKNYFPAENLQNIWGPDLFKPPTLFVFGVAGFGLFGIGFIEWVSQRNAAVKTFFYNSPLKYYSYGVLWIYVISIVVGYNLTENIIFHFGRLDFGQAVILFYGMIVFHFILAGIIGKVIFNLKNKHV